MLQNTGESRGESNWEGNEVRGVVRRKNYLHITNTNTNRVDPQLKYIKKKIFILLQGLFYLQVLFFALSNKYRIFNQIYTLTYSVYKLLHFALH